MFKQLTETFTILGIRNGLKKYHALAREHSYFNPKYRLPLIALYLHNVFRLLSKAKLLRLSTTNSRWLYFNRYYPMTRNINLKTLIEKKFPYTYKKTNDYLLSISPNGSVLLNTFFTNASLLFICFTLKNTTSRKIVFLLPDELYKSSRAYLLSTCYAEYRALLDNNKVILINLSFSSIENHLVLLKEKVLIINFLDTPPPQARLFYDVKILRTKLNFRADVLHLAAQMNLPIHTFFMFFDGYSLKTKEYVPYSLNMLDFKASVVQYTMEKMFAPLKYLLNINPAIWLGWFCLKEYKPVFPNTTSKAKKPLLRGFKKPP